VAGVALGDIDVHSVWQVHLCQWAGWSRAWVPIDAVDAAAVCVARGSWRRRGAFCVAGVALCNTDGHSAWQAWHLWHWAGSGGVLGSRLTPWTPLLFVWQVLGDIHLHLAWQASHLATSTCILRSRRGTYGTRLGLVPRLRPVGRPGRCGTLRGRCGAWRHPSTFCVAGVALSHINLRFAWQA